MKKGVTKNRKSVIIIGGSGGIGRATANVFLKAGWRVFNFQQKADSISQKDNSRFFEILGDVSSVKDVQGLVTAVHQESGGPEAVVFAPSAPFSPKPLAEKKWSDFEKHLAVSVTGLFVLSQELMPKIKTGQKIRFIIVATEGVIGRPAAYLADYLSAKAALVSLAKSLAVEIGKWGSTVNIVSPGFTDTPLLKAFPERIVAAAAAGNPMRRIGRPADVAETIFFLANESSGYLNGVNITINGGNVMF